MIKLTMVTTTMWFTMASAASLYAQHAPKATLGTLWSEVANAYPGIKAKNATIGSAEFNLEAVKSKALPQLKAQAQNTYGSYEGIAGAFFHQEGQFNVTGGKDVLERGGAANSFASTTLQWEVFSFGHLRNKTQAATAQLSSVISQKEAYVLHLKKELAQRYISLLYSGAKQHWMANNQARLDTINKIASALSLAGIRPEADSLLAASTYLQAMGDHDKWSGFRQAAEIKLLEISGKQSIDYAASEQRFIHVETPYIGNVNSVNVHHPELEALNFQSRYFAYRGQAEKSISLPSLKLLGGYAYRGSGIGANGTISHSWQSGFQNTITNYLAGIGITWNITNLKTGHLKSAAFLKKAEEAQYLKDQHKEALEAELSSTQSKITWQFAQLHKTKLSVIKAKKAYQMYLARYKSGLITLTELLQIRSLLEKAEDSHIEASNAYWQLLANEATITADFDFLFNNL